MLIIWQLSLPLALHQLNLISEFRASLRIVVPVHEWRMVTVICTVRFPHNAETIMKTIFEGTAIPCVLLCKTFQVISSLDITVCPSTYLKIFPLSTAHTYFNFKNREFYHNPRSFLSQCLVCQTWCTSFY